MNPLWTMFVMPTIRPTSERDTRLRDLDDRMASFLSEKEASDTACPKVLDNIRTAKSSVRREMAARP